MNEAQSFDGWLAIGAALAVGKAFALRVTGANRAWGRNYSREFGASIKQRGFERMPASRAASRRPSRARRDDHLVARSFARAPAQAASSPVIGHKTLASLISAQR